METSVKVKFCIFQHRKTKGHKWLSLESWSGGDRRYLYESTSDTVEPPSQRPSDCSVRLAKYVDYENAVNRICFEGYDIVTQR